MALIFDLGFGCSGGGGGITPTGTISITENGEYDVTGYASADVNVAGSSGKYQLLQRIKDDNNVEIGTVSGFFTDANNVEYAVVCLDAQYRSGNVVWCDSLVTVTDLPIYSTTQWGPWEAKETATFNTQKILDFCAAQSTTSAACTHCRSKSFTIDGTIYYGQLPNAIELNDIIRNHTALNAADTTASSYSSVDFSTGRSLWSSSQYSAIYAWYTSNSGVTTSTYKNNIFFTCPVLELPNQ